MDLTITIERLSDGRWKAALAALPTIFYVGDDEDGVRERMDRLTYALRSPHIHIERVLPDGEVVLTLDRHRTERHVQAPPARSPRIYATDWLAMA